MHRTRVALMRLQLSARQVSAAAVFALALALGACGSSEKTELEYVERPVEDIYNEALKELENGLLVQATLLFDEVERQHPYSVWARRAMLMSSYSLYKLSKYDDAILAAERFLSLHPGNKDVPYAQYLIGLCYYEQIRDVGRDQKLTENAMRAFEELVRRYPNTEYARDARLKIDLTRDHLAGKEMHVGRYYLRRNQHVAAINRFRTVIENYQTTSHVPEALHRLTEAYLAMGVHKEAQVAAAVLGHNFPGSDWYEYSYALLVEQNLEPVLDERSWLAKTWSKVFF